MADYTFTVPVNPPQEVGVSVDAIHIHRGGRIEVSFVVDGPSGPVRSIQMVVLRNVDGSDATIPGAQRAALRTFILARLGRSLADAGLPPLPAGS